MPIGAIRQSTTRRGRRNSPLALLSQVPRPFRPVYLRIESPLPQTATLRRNGARSLPLVVSLASSRTYLACRTRSLFRERRRATRSRHDASLSSKAAAPPTPTQASGHAGMPRRRRTWLLAGSLGGDMGEPSTARRGRARLGLCGVILAMFVGGCGAGARDASSGAGPSTPLYSEGAAAAAADVLLAAVPLPPDTHRITGPLPGERLGTRPVWGNETPRSVDHPAFWLSTDRPKAILSFILQKGPIPKPGFGGEGSEVLSASLGSPLAGPQELLVTVVPDGVGHYAVRVDAVVTWHQRRPANSLVPATARWLRMTVLTPAFRAWNPGEPSRAHTTKSVITTDTSTIAAVARAVNELPLAEPSGRGPSCPLIEIGRASCRRRGEIRGVA